MYYVRIKKVDVHVDPRDLMNFGYLKAIPRLKLHIILNYTTKLNGKHRKREFHIACVSAEQIVTDHLYQMKNNLSDWKGMVEKRILAGLDRHHVRGGINLPKDDLIRMMFEKFGPEKNSVIKKFRDGVSEYKSLIK